METLLSRLAFHFPIKVSCFPYGKGPLWPFLCISATWKVRRSFLKCKAGGIKAVALMPAWALLLLRVLCFTLMNSPTASYRTNTASPPGRLDAFTGGKQAAAGVWPTEYTLRRCCVRFCSTLLVCPWYQFSGLRRSRDLSPVFSVPILRIIHQVIGVHYISMTPSSVNHKNKWFHMVNNEA